MPVNDFNVGRDVVIDVYDANSGGVITFNVVTGFDRKQESNEVKIKGIDGVCRYLHLPDGWSFDIEITRSDNDVDDYFVNLESLYYSGKNVLGGQITETITETDGTVSQYQYEKISMTLSDAGSIKGDDIVKMKISGKASRRRKIV